MGQWENADGLSVRFGAERPTNHNLGGEVKSFGGRHTLTYRFDYTKLPSFTSDLNNNGTRNGFSLQDIGVPAGASVEAVKLKVGTAWASGTDLTVGTYQQDGTVIDADGFVTAVNGAVANLTAGSIVAGSGADVGEQVSASNVGYVVVAANGTFTAGSAVLVIDYIK